MTSFFFWEGSSHRGMGGTGVVPPFQNRLAGRVPTSTLKAKLRVGKKPGLFWPNEMLRDLGWVG